ncbi:hypothetical protein M405DRAFT_892873, partial [Rhizopogon salebrosus TDB-379]
MGSCKIKIYFLYSSFCEFLSVIVSSTADIAVSSLQGKVGYGNVNLIMRVSDMFVCEYVLACECGISSSSLDEIILSLDGVGIRHYDSVMEARYERHLLIPQVPVVVACLLPAPPHAAHLARFNHLEVLILAGIYLLGSNSSSRVSASMRANILPPSWGHIKGEIHLVVCMTIFRGTTVSCMHSVAITSGKVGYGDVNLIMRVSNMFICEYVLARKRGISSSSLDEIILSLDGVGIRHYDSVMETHYEIHSIQDEVMISVFPRSLSASYHQEFKVSSRIAVVLPLDSTRQVGRVQDRKDNVTLQPEHNSYRRIGGTSLDITNMKLVGRDGIRIVEILSLDGVGIRHYDSVMEARYESE